MSFRLFGFPVTVDAGFLLIALLLAAGRSDPGAIVIWVAVVFVSILIHELGHAFAARAFGFAPRIRLYMMGGLTSWQQAGEPAPGRRLVLSLAGPVAGFLAGGLVFALSRVFPPQEIYLRVAVFDLLWVNFGWGLLNLLPIFPLDGGHVMRAVIHAWRGTRDDRLPLMISVGFGAVAGVLALVNGWLWAAFLAALITVDNVRMLGRLGR